MENVLKTKIPIQYANAYVEILEILKRMSKEDVNKIPEELINKFETLKSKTYKFEYDDYKPLHEQNLLIKTKEILAMLFVNYFATDKEKEIIEQKQKEYKEKNEKILNSKYDINKVFESKKEKIQVDSTETKMITYKKPFYKTIIEKIKNLFM